MISDPRKIYLYVFAAEGCTSEKAIRLSAFRYMKNKGWSEAKSYDDPLFEIRRTEKGKPYLPRLSNIGVSVSHSGEFLVCAVSEDDVGVDVQEMKSLPGESEEAYGARLCKISKRFFHIDEARLIEADPTRRFYRVFTAKESYVKYTGTGFDGTLGEISVLPVNMELESCHCLGLPSEWIAAGVCFWQSVFERDYVLCLCARELFEPVIVRCDR